MCFREGQEVTTVFVPSLSKIYVFAVSKYNLKSYLKISFLYKIVLYKNILDFISKHVNEIKLLEKNFSTLYGTAATPCRS